MKSSKPISKISYKELMDKIIDLKFQLRNKENELNSIREIHTDRMRKIIHDMKNPVGGILSLSELMFTKIDEHDCTGLKKLIDMIHQSAKFSVYFLTQTSRYSNIVLRETTLTFEHLDFCKFLNKTVDNFEQISEKRNIDILRDIEMDNVVLKIDKVHMNEAISNLIDNALKFSPENSAISISLSETYDNAIVTVRDQGIGIKSEDLNRICQEYFVANTYSMDNKKCVGLGLPIAKRIVENHDGELLVKSSENMGTTVTIVLPKVNDMS